MAENAVWRGTGRLHVRSDGNFGRHHHTLAWRTNDKITEKFARKGFMAKSE